MYMSLCGERERDKIVGLGAVAEPGVVLWFTPAYPVLFWFALVYFGFATCNKTQLDYFL